MAGRTLTIQASLQFQPIRRPQAQQKGRPKPSTASSSTAHKFSSNEVSASAGASSPGTHGTHGADVSAGKPQQQPPSNIQKSNFEDWIGDEDEEVYYQRPKYDRGRKKRKKNMPETRIWGWDDIYDPSLPNSYADYKSSEEQFREIRDWKARLYYHQLKEVEKHGGAHDSEGYEPRVYNRKYVPLRRGLGASDSGTAMFAPPSNLNFAPPASLNDDGPNRPAVPALDDDGGDRYPPPSVEDTGRASDYEPPAAFSSAPKSDPAPGGYDNVGMVGTNDLAPPLGMPPVPAAQTPPSLVPTSESSAATSPSAQKALADIAAKKAETQARLAAMKAKLDAARPPDPSPVPAATRKLPQQEGIVPPPPPVEELGSNTTISRAPVRYSPPTAPSALLPDADADSKIESGDRSAPEEEVSRSTRPGQKGFAERLMKKYGWEKGRGLGAQGEGITTAIVAKADKRKKRSDAEGGGWAAPKNMGKIVGGKKRKAEHANDDDDGSHGKMSEVVKLEGMLTGLDVEHEIRENNLLQEIGDEFGEKHGNVERLFIWRQDMGGKDEVFVKFTSQLSALRAVNATDGMTFAGNDVVARFYDGERFDNGEYR